MTPRTTIVSFPPFGITRSPYCLTDCRKAEIMTGVVCGDVIFVSNFLENLSTGSKFRLKHAHKHRSYCNFTGLLSSIYVTKQAKVPGRVFALLPSQKQPKECYKRRIFCLPLPWCVFRKLVSGLLAVSIIVTSKWLQQVSGATN